MTQERPHKSERFWFVTIFSLFGPIIWTLHLGAIYGVQHVACALSPRADSLLALLVTLGATFAALFALAFFGLRPALLRRWMSRVGLSASVSDFLVAVARLLVLLSFFGVLWEGAAALFIAECPALR